jgi:hypothetical protein
MFNKEVPPPFVPDIIELESEYAKYLEEDQAQSVELDFDLEKPSHNSSSLNSTI